MIVSACLLGFPCNHNGRASPSAALEGLARGGRQVIPICPEVAGGLPIPRPAAERLGDGRVVTGTGEDVTEFYRRGAAAAVEVASAAGVTEAVLKARSPSCGCHQIYDGTFTRTLIDGEGVTAAALRTAGVAVHSEEDIEPGD